MNEGLMTVLVDTIAFLELSGDDVISPDAAVRQMEEIAATLKSLKPEEVRELDRFCRRRAQDDATRGADELRVELIRNLLEALGLEL